MSKRKDPAMLANFRFLPGHLKSKVENFIQLLEEPCQEFAVKRYLDNKNFSIVAEEMGYAERSLYNIRELIIDRWEFYINSNDNTYERAKARIFNVLEKYGPLKHDKLTNNLRGYGYTRKELGEIIKILVDSGNIMCEIKYNSKGQPTKKYNISITRGKNVHEISTSYGNIRATHNA